MNGDIVSNEANVGSGSSRKVLKRGANCRRDGSEHTMIRGPSADVNDKKVGGWLRCTDHVFGWSDVLHDAFTEFGSQVDITPAVGVRIKVTEIGGGSFINLGAHVTPPPPTVLEPSGEGIDVHTALLTSNDTSRAWLNHVNLIVFRSGRSKGTEDATDRDFSGSGKRGGSGDLRAAKPENTTRRFDGVINFVRVD